jgi:glyoxylase-like metal-dependent hydrolase (beta-lactamase superfamily II)
MKTVIPGLYASAPEPLPFGDSLEIRALLLQREQGNLLIYRANTLEGEVEAINDLGGISRQYLNHRHEAAPTCDWVAETFGAPLHVHADDAPSVAKVANVAETFSERHRIDDDFEVIPTPGHTPGATAYLWDSGEYSVLFTGDTLFFPRGEWQAAVLDSSDRAPYIQSLELIRGLDFGVLVPSIAAAGQPFHAFAQRAEAERRIDEVLHRVRQGQDH